MNFKDHFSRQASHYAAFRPKAPAELFSYISSLVETRKLAWDAGTGNGQAALALTSYFENVVATDASAKQIEQASAHPKIRYVVARAEEPILESGSVNLITVARALHWFDFDRFYTEARRVSDKNAVIAAWTYELASISPEIDRLCEDYYRVKTAKYWPAERKWVEEGYRTLPFPFREIAAPKFQMVEERSLIDWVGYLYTWSATQNAIKDLGEGFFEDFTKTLKKVWVPAEAKKTVRWPLFLRVWHVH